MTDDRLLMTGVPYVCRICGAVTTIYIRVTADDDGNLVADAPRITENRCEDCEQDGRVHVLAVTLSDPSDEAAHIEPVAAPTGEDVDVSPRTGGERR